jgi:ADP-ribose pyrophosphatase YjhB (NUDIX family)
VPIEPRQVFQTYEPAPGAHRWPAHCAACGAPWPDPPAGPACPRCGQRTFRNPFPAVSVIVADGPRFVLCRRRGGAFQGGAWCLPCGYIDHDEDFLSAARREVREEAGIAVAVRGVVSVVSNFFRPDLHSLVIVLLATPLNPAAPLRGGDDIEEAAWFDDPLALPPMAFEADTHIIARYFADTALGVPVDPRFAGGAPD